jgi:L-malate glycosyltransferase
VPARELNLARAETPIGRVCIIATSLPPGGKERVISHLVTALEARGVRTTVICLAEEGEYGQALRQSGRDVVVLGSTSGADLRAIWRLSRVLRDRMPDVLNIHDLSSLPYVQAANRLGTRVPAVMSCHGILLSGRKRGRLVERWAARSLGMVTAVSDKTAAEYAALLDWPHPVRLIRNGVPLYERSLAARTRLRGELSIPEECFTYLAVGNIAPEKGYEDLLRAMEVLFTIHGTKGRLLVAGTKREGVYWQTLQSIRDRLPPEAAVRFLGYRSDVADLYSAADAFVLSSRKEALPMVLLEAMGAGLPVIATRVGGVPGVVQHEKNGLLVDAAEPRQLAEAMARVQAAEMLRHRLGDQAKSTIQEEYTVDVMCSGYVRAYLDACRRLEYT